MLGHDSMQTSIVIEKEVRIPCLSGNRKCTGTEVWAYMRSQSQLSWCHASSNKAYSELALH